MSISYDHIHEYLRIIPESMRYDIRKICDDAYFKLLEASEDMQRIEKYATNPTIDSTFQEVDDALYLHEAQYYHYCGSGGGNNPNESAIWRLERNRLRALWNMKCPVTIPSKVDTKLQILATSIMRKFKWCK